MRIELHNAYAEDYLATIESGVFDLGITSPEYDKMRKYEVNERPFNWKAILKQSYRVLKKGGVLVWIVRDQIIRGRMSQTSFKQALYAQEVVGFWHYDTMFYSTNKPPMNAGRYQPFLEYMFIFSKGKPKTIHILQEASTYAGSSVGGVYTHQNTIYGRKARNRKPIKPTKNRSHVWHYNTGRGHSNLDGIGSEYKATFPEGLARDHILSWSEAGDHVFDPMTGSGTVGTQCIPLNRSFTGIDVSPIAIEIAERRIAYAMKLKEEVSNGS